LGYNRGEIRKLQVFLVGNQTTEKVKKREYSPQRRKERRERIKKEKIGLNREQQLREGTKEIAETAKKK
jgi:hypothetical protein